MVPMNPFLNCPPGCAAPPVPIALPALPELQEGGKVGQAWQSSLAWPSPAPLPRQGHLDTEHTAGLGMSPERGSTTPWAVCASAHLEPFPWLRISPGSYLPPRTKSHSGFGHMDPVVCPSSPSHHKILPRPELSVLKINILLVEEVGLSPEHPQGTV